MKFNFVPGDRITKKTWTGIKYLTILKLGEETFKARRSSGFASDDFPYDDDYILVNYSRFKTVPRKKRD